MSVSTVGCRNTIRAIVGANGLHIRAAYRSPLQGRALSTCRRHDASIRAKRESIRQHIRGLEAARRKFTSTPAVTHGHIDPPKPGEELHVTFIDKDGDSHEFEVAEGNNLLDIAQANDLEMEGACGGSCACSTCHVIVQDEDLYDKIPEADDDEVGAYFAHDYKEVANHVQNDMLDLAFGLTETSRLGCQIKMTKDIDGIVVKLPSMTRNMQAGVSGTDIRCA